METRENWITDPAVLEFVTVAAEYCAMLEQLAEYDKEAFVVKMQKLLPLLYLKASLLPKLENSEEGFVQCYVSEDDWVALFLGMKDKLGEDDEYLEVFDKRMEYSEGPLAVSLAENFADIYQDLRNFLANFHLGTEQVIKVYLYQLQANFTEYWGQYAVNALRAIHYIVTKDEDNDAF